MPGREELPSTVRRSPAKAQETWVKAHDSAVEEYGEGERAHRTAYGALKHGFEKVGDHWEAKPGGARGPSDERSARPRGQPGESYGGVDANASKQHLLGLARRLGVPGRSSMTKQVAAAIQKENDRRTAAARDGRRAGGGECDDGGVAVQGLPGRSLVDAARRLGAQLLVVGSRSEKAMSWLFGSQYVLRNAPCPVLVVPDTG